MEEKRDHLEGEAVFYYADELNVSWQPTLRAMWTLVGQQVMIPTPLAANQALWYRSGKLPL